MWQGGVLTLEPTEGDVSGAPQERGHREPCPKQPVPPTRSPALSLPDSPSESMLFKAVGGMMDTLYWPRGHLLPKSSLQAL